MKSFCLVIAIVAFATALHAAVGTRRVSFERHPAKNTVLLVIRNETFSVSFNQKHAWNVAEIRFNDRVVGQASGATGTVIHWDSQAVGTGHGGELVDSATLTLDGRDVPLQQLDKLLFNPGDTHEAREIVLSRHSRIGPLRAQVRFVFPASTDSYTVTQSYEVMEDITPERFAGYKYAFMHMMPEAFTEWRTFRADGTGRHGQNAPGERKAHRDPDAEINTPFQALACYAPDWGLGIVYAYPREYEGKNHLLHRGGKDNKFRAMLFRETGHAKGEKLEFTMSLMPFKSMPDAWISLAGSLAQSRHFLPIP